MRDGKKVHRKYKIHAKALPGCRSAEKKINYRQDRSGYYLQEWASISFLLKHNQFQWGHCPMNFQSLTPADQIKHKK